MAQGAFVESEVFTGFLGVFFDRSYITPSNSTGWTTGTSPVG